jgi:hypothetical protein
MILPNYSTPHACSIVGEFAAAMQKEVDFVLTELATHISNNKATQKSTSASNNNAAFANEYHHKQQSVDDCYYDVLEHFNYLCNSK